MSYMMQNKKQKQTLESAQYGMEISFNAIEAFMLLKYFLSITCSVVKRAIMMISVNYNNGETGSKPI